jgi:predicted transcriptional regulator
MKVSTRSILQELNEIAEVRNTEAVIESRATNIINSAINLIDSIRKHYSEDDAKDLENRLVNSIKGQDAAKFSRGIRRVTESRKQARKQLRNE